ncbi:MAG TPA: hypothetical protein VFE10_10345 [Phenylobacterium sp.]|nr:hypothetical protein [Phenylobacterium sp.]
MLMRFVNGAELRRSGEMVAWMGVCRLATETGFSENTVAAAIRDLIAHGYVECVRQGGGSRVTNRYRLIAHTPPAVASNTAKSEVFCGVRVSTEDIVHEVENPANFEGLNPANDAVRTPQNLGPNPWIESLDLNPSQGPGQ